MFTDGETVLAALQRVFYNAEEGLGPDGEMVEGISGSGDKTGGAGATTNLNLGPPTWSGGMSPRRVSGASSVSGKFISFLLRKYLQFFISIELHLIKFVN